MDTFDSFVAVLDYAIIREIEASQFYMDLAKQMKNPAMSKVFEAFAKEELGHKVKLEAIKQGKDDKTRQRCSTGEKYNRSADCRLHGRC